MSAPTKPQQVSWWMDSAGITYEQSQPYGRLLAVYDRAGDLIIPMYRVTWAECTGLVPTTVGRAAR